MTILTASDYADTGQWRLIIRIRRDGMSAHLENTLHDDVEPTELFVTNWDPDPDTLLTNIENAVYDNPRVLDDFSARIEIYDPRTAFIPTSVLTDGEGEEDACYTALYDAKPSDIIYAGDGDVTAAFSMVPGLKGFLSRTFPGARIGCNLMNTVSRQRKAGAGLRLHLEVRGTEADIVLTDGDRLISASTRQWAHPADIAYHAFNLMDVYGVKTEEVAVTNGGLKLPDEVAGAFKTLARSFATDLKHGEQ